METLAPQRKRIDWLLVVGIMLVIAAPITICAWLAWPGIAPYTTPFPHVVGRNCGAVYDGSEYDWMSLEHYNSVDPLDAEQCLQQAFATCKTATVMYTFSNGLARTDDALFTKCHDGKRALSVSSVFFGDSGPPPPFNHSPVTTVQCASMRQGTDPNNDYLAGQTGLLLTNCANGGDQFFPARPASQKGDVCGTLRNEGGDLTSLTLPGVLSNPPDASSQPQDNPHVSDCFWQAYTSCSAPKTLVYITITKANNVQTSIEHTLVAQPNHGACALTDETYSETLTPSESGPYLDAKTQTGPTYPCASLTRDASGYLTAHHCGAEGDVVIAPSSTVATPTAAVTPSTIP